MKKALIVSIIFNVLLIIIIGVGYRQFRVVAFQMVADSTSYATSMQEHFLRELESGDTQRMESIKSEMSRNIKKGKEDYKSWCTAK